MDRSGLVHAPVKKEDQSSEPLFCFPYCCRPEKETDFHISFKGYRMRVKICPDVAIIFQAARYSLDGDQKVSISYHAKSVSDSIHVYSRGRRGPIFYTKLNDDTLDWTMFGDEYDKPDWLSHCEST